jgi:MFS family permease
MTVSANLPIVSRRADDVRLVAGVSAAHLVSHYYILVLPPLFAFVRAEYNVSYTELGLALSVFNVVSAVLQTPAGFLIDRVNARLCLVAGLLLGAIGLAGAALVNSYWFFVAMFGVMGIGNTVYHPADYALISRHVAPERMSQSYSIHTFAGLVGGALAPGTMLFMHSLWGWRGAFLNAATLGATVAAALLVMREPPEQPAKPRADAQTGADDNSWRLLLSPAILMGLLFFFMLATASFGLQNFVVVALGALHGTPAVTANAALTGYLILSAAGVLLGGLIATRTSRQGLVAMLGLAIAVLVIALVGVVDLHATALILLLSLSGLTTGMIMPSRDMLIRAVTPAGSFGKVFGFVTNGFNLGGAISPLIFGALMDHGEPQLVFLLLASFLCLAILTVAARPRRQAA